MRVWLLLLCLGLGILPACQEREGGPLLALDENSGLTEEEGGLEKGAEEASKGAEASVKPGALAGAPASTKGAEKEATEKPELGAKEAKAEAVPKEAAPEEGAKKVALEAEGSSDIPAPKAESLDKELPAGKLFIKPGAVIRNPKPYTAEWLIQEVLAASLETDFERGWQRFVRLLHEDERLPKALASRRSLNYPASRRKVQLFIYEEGEKPIYRVDRLLEDGEGRYRIFVHNKSPNGMPTPCHVRYEAKDGRWWVTSCSL